MRRGRAIDLALLLAALLLATPAHARRPKSFSLNWVRAPSAEACVASHQLASIIEGALGPLFVPPADAEFSIEGSVSARDGTPGYEARIVVSDRDGAILGQRRLHSDAENCRALDPQIVLVIAMAIDPEIALDALPPELLAQLDGAGDPAAELLHELRAEARDRAANAGAEAQKPPDTAATQLQPEQPHAAPQQPATEAAPRESTAATVVISGRFALGLALLPNLAAAPGLALQVRPAGALWFEIATLFWLENDAHLQSPTPLGDAVHFNMSLVTLALCFEAWRSRPWRLGGCAGAAGSARWTDGEALARRTDVTRFDAGPALSTELALATAAPWILGFGAALHAPLRRERFVYGTPDGERALFVPGRIAAWSWLGLGAEF